jgi:aryl-alcohol dehydrogenase-like predicted oxidoreductase
MKTKSIALGTANFSDSYRLSGKEPFSAQDILITAFENGIDCLDVSDAYDGAYREIEKSGINWKLNAKIVLSDSHGSHLKEVNQKVVDLLEDIPKAQIHCLMIHNSSKLSGTILENALEAIETIRKRFYIDNVGLSLYPDDEDKIVINSINTIQIPVNILDQRIFSSPMMSNQANKISDVQARSIFLRGLLANSDTSQSVVGEKDLTDLKLFHKWCSTNEVNPIFACINFVYHLNFIDTIVLGVNSKRELMNNLKAIEESKAYKIKTDFKNFKSTNLNLIDPRRWKV